MASSNTLRNLFSRLTIASPSPAPTAIPKLSNVTSTTMVPGTLRAASSKAVPKGGKKGKPDGRGKKKKGGDGPDPRIVNLRQSMPRGVPSPLRFGRNRYLRHWTIHRAWLLFQRQQRESKEKELNRMYQSMSNACEELRKTSGPGTRDEGYLYRVAMGKQGVYGRQAIPIEYARFQTETPARQVWDHEWTR